MASSNLFEMDVYNNFLEDFLRSVSARSSKKVTNVIYNAIEQEYASLEVGDLKMYLSFIMSYVNHRSTYLNDIDITDKNTVTITRRHSRSDICMRCNITINPTDKWVKLQFPLAKYASIILRPKKVNDSQANSYNELLDVYVKSDTDELIGFLVKAIDNLNVTDFNNAKKAAYHKYVLNRIKKDTSKKMSVCYGHYIDLEAKNTGLLRINIRNETHIILKHGFNSTEKGFRIPMHFSK